MNSERAGAENSLFICSGVMPVTTLRKITRMALLSGNICSAHSADRDTILFHGGFCGQARGNFFA
jgi:hypothetical protein